MPPSFIPMFRRIMIAVIVIAIAGLVGLATGSYDMNTSSMGLPALSSGTQP